MAEKKREQTPERREQTRRAVAKHEAKKRDEEVNAVTEAVENKEAIDIADFDVLAEAMDALATVKSVIRIAPPGSVAGLAGQQLKLAIEIDKYRRELAKQEADEKAKEDSVFDD